MATNIDAKTAARKALVKRVEKLAKAAVQAANATADREILAIATVLVALAKSSATRKRTDIIESAANRWLETYWDNPFPRPKDLEDKSEACLQVMHDVTRWYRLWPHVRPMPGERSAMYVAHMLTHCIGRGSGAVLGIVPDKRLMWEAIEKATMTIAEREAGDGIVEPYAFAYDDAAVITRAIFRAHGMPASRAKALVRAAEKTIEAHGGEDATWDLFLAKRRRVAERWKRQCPRPASTNVIVCQGKGVQRLDALPQHDSMMHSWSICDHATAKFQSTSVQCQHHSGRCV